MRIAVIGAGMGGMAAASLLAHDGHAVTLIERFAAPQPLGSGLVIQPVGLAVLDEIGAGDAARTLGAPIRRMLGHAGRRAVLDVSYRRTDPGLAMHRASLFHVLWQAMQGAGVTLLTGRTITAALPDGAGLRIETDQGESLGPFDLVVDASGAGSRLSPIRTRPLPFGAIWGHVPWPEASDLPRDMLRQRYRRADRMAGILPIGRLPVRLHPDGQPIVGQPGPDRNPADDRPRAAVFWSMPAEDLATWPGRDFAEWKAEVTELWPEMAPFLAALPDNGAMTPARYSHGTLRRPFSLHSGCGLAFIGDAAHRASPQLGQGANMALLDALALTRALRGRSVEQALPAYAAMRRWHVWIYQAMSAGFTPAYQSRSRWLPPFRDLVMAPLSHIPPAPAILTRLVSGDLIPPLAGEAWPQQR